MHEVSLGYTIKDYLSGQDLEATTYEDLRQAIVRMLVERKGYPANKLYSKVGIEFEIDNQRFLRKIDLVAYSDTGSPLLILLFCPGEVETYIRECLAAARLHPGQPAQLAVVTDTQNALILCVADGKTMDQVDYQAIPTWEMLESISAQCPAYTLTEKKKVIEERILYAYSELSCYCSGSICPL